MLHVWLITGSSRGLGRALAEVVFREGHKLVATARSPEQLGDLVERYGDQVRAVALDVTDARAASNAVKATVDTFGRLDVLVNNAGYGDVGSIENTTDSVFRADRDESLRRHQRHEGRDPADARGEARSHHPDLLRRRAPRDAWLGFLSNAQWGVEGFSEVLAKEVAPLGINV
jgi:NAD(P)-dependent dehydrogenase (short-subunit alcohol dehydrogenase family)